MMSTTEKVLERPQLAQGSLLDEIMAQTRIAPSEEGYDIAKKGVAAFIENLMGSQHSAEPVNKSLVDQMLVELDKKSVHRWMKSCTTRNSKRWNRRGAV
ncbi:evpB family type VI secretion protein [Vibrio cholerae O1 str. NHCC-008D]|nr:evpB family type VI secretion protein [Vibrio cholerae O1 str. NHCC-008D]